MLERRTRERADVVSVGERIVKRLGLPSHLNGREAWLGASVGAAATGDGLHPSEMMDAADLALRTAKDGGEARLSPLTRIFVAGPGIAALENALRFAVDRSELFCLYQPKVDLVSGELLGVEALVRWDRPGRGIVPPFEFIPVAEASGLIARVDHWVLSEGVRQLAEWNGICPNRKRLGLSTNMSAWQLARVDVDDDVARAISWQGGVDPSQLTIELTETLLVEDPALVIRRLERVRSTGVGISVDDFGAGFTSIAYLRRFPISEVKVDRSLVDELTGGPEDDRSVVAAVIALARAMDLDVIAEGVETVEQTRSRAATRMPQGPGLLFRKAPSG